MVPRKDHRSVLCTFRQIIFPASGFLALAIAFLAYAPAAHADDPLVSGFMPLAIASPPDIVVEGNVANGASRVALGTPSVPDNVAFRPSFSNDAPAIFPLGTTAVTWTATDPLGNKAAAVQNVTVVDTIPPSLVPPSHITVEQASPEGTEVSLGSPRAWDHVDANPTVSNDAPALFPLGTTQVIWTATDTSGNRRWVSQIVTVVDTTPPGIIPPGDMTREPRTSRERAVVLGTPMVTDAGDANPSVTNDAPAIFPLGTTVVTWTATDASGNRATAVQKVTVVDTRPPYILPLRGVRAEAVSPAGAPLNLPAPRAFDNFDPSPVVISDAPAAFPLGRTIVTWTATDSAGNKGGATQEVIIVDTTPPVIEQPKTLIVELAYRDGTPVELVAPGVRDNGDDSPVVASDARAAYPLGNSTVTWTATDASGNKSTAAQAVVVMDTTPPKVLAPPPVTAEANLPGGAILYDLGKPIVTDIGDAAPVITNDSRYLFLMGANTVMWMATDFSGNMGYAFQTVYVVPATGDPTPAPVSAGGGYAYPTATPGGPPRIPHDLTGRSDCLACHASGLAGAKLVPPSHSGRTNTMCQNCHIAIPQAPTPTRTPTATPPPGTTPAPRTPPNIPHDLTGRDNCLACHATGLAAAPILPASHAGRTSDMCRWCHVPASQAAPPTATPPPGSPAAPPGGGPTATATPVLGPPRIPHDLAGRSDCRACHATGLVGAPILPASHAGRTSDMCLLCHVPASQAPLPTPTPPTGATAAPTVSGPPGAPSATATPVLGPPRIPHDLAGRSDCRACHATGLVGAPILPASHAGRTSDTCLLCHVPASQAPLPTATPPPGATATPTVSGPPAGIPTMIPLTATPTAPAPPRIPHNLAGRSDCLACHASGAGGAPRPPASHAGRTSGVCLLCHVSASQAPSPTPTPPAATATPTVSGPPAGAPTATPPMATPPNGPTATATPSVSTPTATPTPTRTPRPRRVDAGGPYSGREGSPVAFRGESDDDEGEFTYSWDFGDGATGSGARASHTYADNGAYTARLTVRDRQGISATDTATVTISNVAPTVDAGSNRSVTLLAGLSLTASFTDRGARDTHTATVNWGDGAVDSGTVTENGGVGSVSGGHVYTRAGSYTVRVTVTDKDGGQGSDTLRVAVSNSDDEEDD
ncbi:MAG: HYR domain-containing protein [Chloroflexi bacterium]|nr:HYR domain-containing protein [Chloroflexota bacterium]